MYTPTGSSKVQSKQVARHEDDLWVQEHVFTVPKFHHGDADPHVFITTSSRKPVSVTLSIPGVGFEIKQIVNKDRFLCDIDLSLSNTNGRDIRTLQGIGKQNKTVIVRSSGIVNVHVINNDKGEGDGFVVIPTDQLGTKHYVESYQPFYESDPAFVCITALHANTSIYIQTNQKKIRQTLCQYESYRFDGDQNEDLSGTFVEGDKPIAVISGVLAKVLISLRGHADGLLVQIPPTNMWGMKYIIAPYQSLDDGYLYRVQTLNISTTLNMSDGEAIEIRPEEESFYEADVTENGEISFTSNQPVMVVQYIKKRPAVLIIPPVTRYGHNVTFPVFGFADLVSVTYSHFITVIAECSAIYSGFSLDGVGVVEWHQNSTVDGAMCYASREVPPGQHSITHTNPVTTFAVSVYGICKCPSSYAYSAKAYYSQGKYHHINIPVKFYFLIFNF